MQNFKFLKIFLTLLLCFTFFCLQAQSFKPNEEQKQQLRKKIAGNNKIIYKDAFYTLCLEHFFLDNSGLKDGIDSSNFLNTDIGLTYNVFKVKDYYIGVLFDYRATKIILLSKKLETLDITSTYESWDEPHYKLKDVNNDGISEFVFYEYDGCNSCTIQGIKTKMFGIDTIHNKLSLMLSFSKSVSTYQTVSCEKLLREDKSVVHFTNKNEAEISFFYHDKNKKWLFLRTEKYILDKELNIYKKLD